MSKHKQESPPVLFVFGLCTIAEGLCQVLSLGFWVGPSLGLKFLIWNLDRRTDSAQDRRERE